MLLNYIFLLFLEEERKWDQTNRLSEECILLRNSLRVWFFLFRSAKSAERVGNAPPPQPSAECSFFRLWINLPIAILCCFTKHGIPLLDSGKQQSNSSQIPFYFSDSRCGVWENNILVGWKQVLHLETVAQDTVSSRIKYYKYHTI